MFHWGAVIPSEGTTSDVARLDCPPPSSARLRLPDAMGRRFAIFADAEEEFDWKRPFSRDASSTEAIDALPKANRFFTDRGCVPTYLVDWPVVANPASAAVMHAMASDGRCDIGTQLHPWVNPPFEEDITVFNSYAGNLPPLLEAAKLKALTDKIERETGVRPTVYRAGRYGIGPNTAGVLGALGYRLDVSVRATFDYRNEGGPDFSQHPIWPWRLCHGLAEVPLTVTKTGILRHKIGFQDFAPARGFLARTGLFDRVPLTPEGVRLHDALIAVRQLLDSDHQLFSLSFHTPSVVPGHTPYVRTASDLKKFWAWWDGVFDLFARHDVLPIRSGEIATALEAA
jgi:hypothetical protein